MVAQPDEPDWPAHEAAAAGFAGATVPLRARSVLYPGEQEDATRQWLAALRASPPEVIASLLLLLIRQAADEGGWSHDTAERVQRLGRLRWTIRADDAIWAVHATAALPDTWSAADVLCGAVALASRAEPPGDRGLREALAVLASSAREREYVPPAQRTALLRALTSLAAAPANGAGGGGLAGYAGIEPGDGWSAAVLAELAGWDACSAPVRAMLGHLRAAAGSRPARTWLDRCTELAGDRDAVRLIKVLLEAALTAPGAMTGQANLIVSEANGGLLRAAAWAASVTGADWVVTLLRDLAVRAIAGTRETGIIEPAVVPAACACSLGLVATPAAIAALGELRGVARDRGGSPVSALRGQADAALAVAAKRVALPSRDLAEYLADDGGLDSAGLRLVTCGKAAARVAITPDWKVSTRWRTGRAWSDTPPRVAGATARHLVRGAVGEARQALEGERARLERLLGQGRQWPLADWRARYCEHPVTGSLSRGLIWVIEPPDDEPLTGMPARPGTLLTLNGPRQLPASGMARLWHPATAEPAEVASWRDAIAASAYGQPFSQAFREVYPATADELLPAAKSTGRFEGRVLRYPLAREWLASHGWIAGYLEPFSGASTDRARRDFPDAGLTAVFEHRAAGCDSTDLCAEFCQAGRLAFHRTRNARTPVRLNRVPELVFTETVRDLELLIAATEVVG